MLDCWKNGKLKNGKIKKMEFWKMENFKMEKLFLEFWKPFDTFDTFDAFDAFDTFDTFDNMAQTHVDHGSICHFSKWKNMKCNFFHLEKWHFL